MANPYNQITTRANGETIEAGWFNGIRDTLVNNGAVKHNKAGTTAPTTTDDDTSNYEPGSTWTDTTNDKFYVCVDASTAAAVWKEMATLSSGLVPISLGGTGQSTQTEGFDALAPTTTTGDIIYHDGSDNVRLAAGTDGHVLTLSSGSPVWQSAPTGTPSDTSKTSAYTATTADEYIRCDSSSAAFTVTLYAASGNAGQRLTIIKTNADLDKPVTIDGNASETINGATTFLLYTQYESVTIECDGSNWIVVGRHIPQRREAISASLSGTWSTNTTYSGYMIRHGGDANITMEIILSGAPTGTLDLNMPTNMTIDTSRINVSSGQILQRVGECSIYDSSAGNRLQGGVYINATGGSDTLRVVYYTDVGTEEGIGSVNATSPFTFATGDEIHIDFTVPITGWEG